MISKLFYLCLIILCTFAQEVSAQNFDAEVVKYATLCVVEKDKLVQTDTVAIQINNRVGDEYTEISIPYSKNKKVSDLDAWIEDMDGARVRVLKKSEIIDRSAFSDMYLYADNFNKCFQLKHNVYPYRVVYTYKTTSRDFLYIAGWSPMLYRDIPTRKAVLNIIISKNIPFNEYVNNMAHGSCIASPSSNLLLKWTASYNKPVKPEIYSQPEDIKPYVIVAPLNFQYGVEGSTKDWESYGNWQYRLCQDLDMLPIEEKNTISTLIKDVTDKREIVKVLYHYLQDHTRYINVSIGIGGFKPYPASDVAQNKYGDCKALTNYMKAMLSFAGIESFYTTVNADEQPESIKNFAGPQFNHVVLAVPLKNDTIWLENTNNTNPFGYIGTSIQNREALLNCKDHSRLIRVPALKMEDVHDFYNMDFDLNILGSGKVKLNISFKGADFEWFNEFHADFNEVEKDRYIRDNMPFDNYEVTNWNLKKLHRDTARIELNAALNLNKFIKALGNEYYFNIYPCRIPAFAPPANRTLPVELPFPICNSYQLIYILPAGFELKSRFEPVSIKTPFGAYESAINVDNGKILVTKRFELYPGSYSVGQYAEFYFFIQSVKDADRKKIIIKPKN